MFYRNRGEDEETTFDFKEIALNKKDDISSEERVSRNPYAAANHLEKQN